MHTVVDEDWPYDPDLDEMAMSSLDEEAMPNATATSSSMIVDPIGNDAVAPKKKPMPNTRPRTIVPIVAPIREQHRQRITVYSYTCAKDADGPFLGRGFVTH